MIVGLVSRAGGGKDECARGLSFPPSDDAMSAVPEGTWDGAPWKRVAFADKLKEAAAIIFDFDQDQLHGVTKDVTDHRWGFSPRKAFQLLGTEVGRSIRPDVWILAAERRVKELRAAGRHVVITDCRFVDEAAAIHRWGGFVVRIARDPSTYTMPFELDMNHPSEVEMSKIECDGVIANDGTVVDLHTAIWTRVLVEMAKEKLR